MTAVYNTLWRGSLTSKKSIPWKTEIDGHRGPSDVQNSPKQPWPEGPWPYVRLGSTKANIHRSTLGVGQTGKDAIILKTISPPSMDEFDELIKNAPRQARKAGMKQSDIKDAVTKVRGRR